MTDVIVPEESSGPMRKFVVELPQREGPASYQIQNPFDPEIDLLIVIRNESGAEVTADLTITPQLITIQAGSPNTIGPYRAILVG